MPDGDAAFGADQRDGLVACSSDRPTTKHGGALARESQRARPADAAAAAGDDRPPAFEPPHRCFSYLAGTVQPPSAVITAPCT